MRDQNTRVLEPFPSLFSVFVSPQKKKKKQGCWKCEIRGRLVCVFKNLKIFVEIRVGERVY